MNIATYFTFPSDRQHCYYDRKSTSHTDIADAELFDRLYQWLLPSSLSSAYEGYCHTIMLEPNPILESVAVVTKASCIEHNHDEGSCSRMGVSTEPESPYVGNVVVILPSHSSLSSYAATTTTTTTTASNECYDDVVQACFESFRNHEEEEVGGVTPLLFLPSCDGSGDGGTVGGIGGIKSPSISEWRQSSGGGDIITSGGDGRADADAPSWSVVQRSMGSLESPERICSPSPDVATNLNDPPEDAGHHADDVDIDAVAAIQNLGLQAYLDRIQKEEKHHDVMKKKATNGKGGGRCSTPPPPPPPSLLRPLSPYNYFFRDERERILQEHDDNEAVKHQHRAADEYELLYTVSRQEMILHDYWQQDRTKRRSHRKSHGRISFASLSKLVSRRWQILPEQYKKFYKEISAKDWERYHRELHKYQMKHNSNSDHSNSPHVTTTEEAPMMMMT